MSDSIIPDKMISKSNYVTAKQCRKILWMNDHKPEEAVEAGSTSSIEEGTRIGNIAKGYYGDYEEIPYDTDYAKMAEKTRDLIEARTPIICEATFIHDDCLCMVDILRVSPDGKLSITEVKSSTKVKDEHISDIAFQLYVLRACGYDVESVSLMHVDNSYVRQGELDLKSFFTIEDKSEEANKAQDDIEEELESLRDIRRLESEPDIELSPHCNKPYECKYKRYCWSSYPSPNVFDIVNIRKKAIDFRDIGILSFEDLYSSDCFDSLNEKQKMQVSHHVEQKEPHINKEEIEKFLDAMWYPMHFLDFESFMLACPIYDGTWPYQQIVSQYSLHHLDSEDGKLEHEEFLAKEGEDPRRDVAESLIRDIPKDACIVVWNESFEKNRIKEMAEAFPDLKEELEARNDNVVDLMIPFRNYHWYQKEFGKSASIKSVLPALFPDDSRLDYHLLEGVHNGSEASSAYVSLTEHSPEEIETIREQLLRYCELDTYAMVVIWGKMMEEIFGKKLDL